MCSDLNQDPVLALQLYCSRTWIEVMFGHLKHLIGAFQFRFWSKKMPRHSRTPKTNRTLTAPATADLGKLQQCWQAYERFVMLGAIALGLLQLIALRFTASIWQQHRGFLETAHAVFLPNAPSNRSSCPWWFTISSIPLTLGSYAKFEHTSPGNPRPNRSLMLLSILNT
jgi:hypothetical protein